MTVETSNGHISIPVPQPMTHLCMKKLWFVNDYKLLIWFVRYEQYTLNACISTSGVVICNQMIVNASSSVYVAFLCI